MPARNFFAFIVLAALAMVATTGARAEALKAAVFDAVFVNSSPQETTPEETARIAALTAHLKEALEKSGQYHVIDLASVKSQVDSVKDIHDCNGCEADIAKAAGAQVAVVAWVQKVSNLILNINIRIVDTATGAPIKGGSVYIRGNDEVSWSRGLKYLLEEHVFNGRR